MKRRASIPKKDLHQRVDEKGKPVAGRFVLIPSPKPYVSRLLRGPIELPHEPKVRAKAEAKRKRKAERRKALS